jgi:hypothetical protein
MLPISMGWIITNGSIVLKISYTLSPEVWQIVCDDVNFLDEDEQPTSDQLQKIHHNAQAISIITS